MYKPNMNIIEDTCNPNQISILSGSNDKIEKYKDILQQVIPFAKSATNDLEKRAAYDFNILFKTAINETNNSVFLYLNDAIEHLIDYFSKDLEEFLTGKVDWINSYNGSYELLHDFTSVIMQTLVYKKNIQVFREFCLQI